jgi:Uncharacterised nucleotidyltransferase
VHFTIKHVNEEDQLAVLDQLHHLLEREGIEYWLFGGWAVDFHVGLVTRPHEDIDLAVWLDDFPRIAALLAAQGWVQVRDHEVDGSVSYEREPVRVELAFLRRDERGEIYTPLRDGRAGWADGAFERDVGQCSGVSANVISLSALRAEKSGPHEDAVATAKGRADLATLSGL